MAIQLREPLFLRGRKRVTERAVIMSLVLASLACVASWIVAAVQTLAEGSSNKLLLEFAVPTVWSLSAAALIHAPLNFWNSRSQFWTLSALPINYGAFFVANAWESYAYHEVGQAISLFGSSLLIVLGNSILLIRTTSLHRLASLASLPGTALIVGVAMLMESNVLGVSVFPFSLLPQELAVAGIYSAYFGAIFIVLSVPWGIPFWWSPDADRPPAAER